MKYTEQNQTLSRIYKKIREANRERKELQRQENLRVLKEMDIRFKEMDKEYELYKQRKARKTSLNAVKSKPVKSYSGLYKLYMGHKLNKLDQRS